MLWVACTLAYFGFLRSSEFTVPLLARYSEENHLGVADIAVDSLASPSSLRVRIKAHCAINCILAFASFLANLSHVSPPLIVSIYPFPLYFHAV